MKAWGLLPDDARAMLRQKEWEHPRHLRQRLLGERPFPITVNLRPPTGKQALDDVVGFHGFVNEWRAWSRQAQLEWKHIQYAQLGEHRMPAVFTLGSIQELVEFLGDDAVKRSQRWQQLLTPILEVNQNLYPVLIRQLNTLEALRDHEANMIAQLLPQLVRGMGQGCYVRALPVCGVDTKFLETHQSLIASLLDEMHGGDVSGRGGLLAWLECIATPNDWLWVRPLSAKTRKALGGIPVLRIPTEVLLATALPGERILVVENEQPGYALPELVGTVAVFGGGRNLAWMDAPWLRHRHVGYWGDLDSWGFVFLADARKRQPHVESLLMGRETLLQHRQRMVEEPDPYPGVPEHLTEPEQQLYLEIRDGWYGNSRLEQERISGDVVRACLSRWAVGVD